MQSVTQKASRDTRELRALELYRKHGEEIHHVGEDLYTVPSCSEASSRLYTVDYAVEVCDCPDFQYRGENCKHILAVGIYAAKRRLRVSAAGDPFVAAERDRRCACEGGWVFVGRVVESEHDLDGEVVEYERVPCRRCAEEAGL